MEPQVPNIPVAAVARGDRVRAVVRRISPNALVARFRTGSVGGSGVVVAQTDALLLVLEVEVVQTVRAGGRTEVRRTRSEVGHSWNDYSCFRFWYFDYGRVVVRQMPVEHMRFFFC